jgi:hypothetical protein
MKKTIQCIVAAVMGGLITGSLSAKTVAWYHFNEGENGTKPASGGTAVFENAADPGSLMGIPYAMNASSTATNTDVGCRPAYTNDAPDCDTWRWHDSVTGERDGDGRCLWMRSSDGNGNGQASVVFVNDDVKLHCPNITVEFMAKIQPGVTLAHWAHMLVFRNSSSANIKAWALMINSSGTVSGQMHTRDSTGAAIDQDKSIDSGFAAACNVVDGKWHHIALTYDGSYAKLYVDYVQMASKARTIPIDYNEDCEGRLCICGNDKATYGRWQGFIDEVRISDEALPPSKFLHPGAMPEKGSKLTDQDTALYLSFDSAAVSDNAFFGTVGVPIVRNETVASNTLPVGISVATSGILPTEETTDTATNIVHSGIFATDSAGNAGCWKFGENTAAPGKSVHLTVDDYSMNNNKHLISSGDFTLEFWLNVPGRPARSCYLVAEMSKSADTSPRGQPGTLLIYTMTDGGVRCRLVSNSELDAYQADTDYSIKFVDMDASGVSDGKWHHFALVVDRTHETATFYVDGKVVGQALDFVLASRVANTATYKPLEISGGWGPDRTDEFHNLSIDELRITRRALAPQEFLMAGVESDADARAALGGDTRAWIDFEGDLSVKPIGASIVGTSTASMVTMEYSNVVPGIPGGSLIDGMGAIIRAANTSSMHFSGAHGSGESSSDTASQRLFFERNILLEKDMKSMTVEFFMKGTKNEAKAWASILRMYGNAKGSDNSPFRRLWSIGYSDTSGHLYVIKDIDGNSQTSFYPDNNVSFADGRWHHIAATFEPDGTGKTLCKFYRDYKQLGSPHTFNGEMECGDYGTSSFAAGSRYNGYLDEVRISKGVLTVDQMLHALPRGTTLHLR